MKLSYEAADRVLHYQQAILQNLRNRATGVLAASVVVLALPYTLGLAATSTAGTGSVRPPLPLWTSWTLLGITVVISAFMMAALWPLDNWAFTADAGKILEMRDCGRSESDVLKSQTEGMIVGGKKNFALLARKHTWYRVALALLLAEAAVLTLGILLT